MFKAENRIETKENAVKEMIKRSGICKHKFELIEKKPSMYSTSKTKIIQRCLYCGDLRKDII